MSTMWLLLVTLTNAALLMTAVASSIRRDDRTLTIHWPRSKGTGHLQSEMNLRTAPLEKSVLLARKKRATHFAADNSKSFFGMRGKRLLPAFEGRSSYLLKRKPSNDDMSRSFFGMRGKRPFNVRDDASSFFALRGRRADDAAFIPPGYYAMRGKRYMDIDDIAEIMKKNIREYIRNIRNEEKSH